MSFDVAIVAYGLSQVLIKLFGQSLVVAYSFFGVVLAIDLLLLYRFFVKYASPERVAPIPSIVESLKQLSVILNLRRMFNKLN